MSIKKGYIQILEDDQTTTTFDAEGEMLIVLSNYSGGTWTLDFVCPDDSVITLGTFTANFTQRVSAPAETKLKLHGGTAGATAWAGIIFREVAGRQI